MSENSTTDQADGVQANFQALFEDAPCGYVVLTPAGRIAHANRTLATWIKIDAGALHSRHLRDLLTFPSRIFYETNFAPALRLQDELEEVALDLVTEGSGTLPVLISARTFRDAGGQLLETRLILVRASQRREYERTLQERQAEATRRLEAEQATAHLREQFIAVLGHDLRNPLASIVGATRLLRREELSEKASRVLDLVESSVDRMAGLIDDVMDFARGQLGSGIAVHRQVAPLEPVLRQVVSELEVDEPSRVFKCVCALKEPVSFDAGRLAQLVSNLLGNAVAHGDARRPIKLHAASGHGQLVLSVINAGEPIPPAAMDRLFKPFFRGEVRDSRQGLGLGLHIASEIAKAHGGVLTVHSDVLETRFTLSMPSS